MQGSGCQFFRFQIKIIQETRIQETLCNVFNLTILSLYVVFLGNRDFIDFKLHDICYN